MPTVDVKMWKGVSEDAVERIISEITKVFVELGIPARAVEVIVQEIPETHWGSGEDQPQERWQTRSLPERFPSIL